MQTKLHYVKGDLFCSDRQIIAHGCNNQGGFGSGVAGQIARRFPEVRNAYKNKYQKEGFELGEIQVVPLWKPLTKTKIIVNLITQASYGKQGIHVSYDACYLAFRTLLRYCQMHMNDLALPKIGSGLGGGRWELVEKELEKALVLYPVEVDIYYL
jgi:O-acetyl-ADP-ribose deacetylase (regulator of RNase III)